MAIINVLEIARVSPATDSGSSGDSPDSLNLPFTFFDIPWLLIHPFQRVIFYKLTESTREFFNSVILPQLKLSLSVVLRNFLPLAGRITWDPRDPKPSIVVSGNDAVSVTVAETDSSDFSVLSGNGKRPETELRALVPELRCSDDSASVFSLQITLFPNQGFCIGITGHHAALDGKTASMFIRSWAHICKQKQQRQEHENRACPSLPEDLTPCLDRSLIKDPTGALDAKMLELVSSVRRTHKKSLKLPPTREIGPDIVRVTFELTVENIEKLRERVRHESPAHQELHLSTFVIACAYTWSCAVKARGGDAQRPVAFLVVADFRHRSKPPVPATYFGNCLFPVGCYGLTARAVSEEKKGFVTAVEILSDVVKGLGRRRVEEIYEGFAEGFKCDKPGTQFASVAGSTRLGVYGSDFGWGKPVKTEVVSIDQSEAFAMAETKDDVDAGGVEIGLCLDNTLMEIFISFFNSGLKL